MKLLLSLSAGHVHLQARTGRSVRAEATYAQHQSAEVRTFLRQYAAPCQVLVDLVEEDFFPLHLPNLPKREQSALLQRRLEARYPGVTLRQARLAARADKTGRHGVLSALTNPALLQPWLEMLAEENIPLLGVYSLALLGAEWLGGEGGDVLLVSFQAHAGLRQSYFRDGQLQFSRLSALFDPADWATEVARTVQFLRRGHAEMALTVRWLSNAHEDERPAIAADWQVFPPRQSESPHDVGAGFMQYLAEHAPAAHYLPAPQRQTLRTWRGQRALAWSGAIWLLLVLLWSGYRWSGQADVSALQSATQSLQRQTQALSTTVSGIPATEVQATVAYFRNHGSATPQQVLTPFSRVWNDFPSMALDELSWQQGASGVVLGVQAHLAQSLESRALAEEFSRLQQALRQQGYKVQVMQAPLRRESSAQDFVLQLERP